MSGGDVLGDDITEWDFELGEALEIVSASVGNLNYWHSTNIAKATPHWAGGSGRRRRWMFTDLVAVQIVWDLADTLGFDIERLRGQDLPLNLQLAQAMFGWDLAVVITPEAVSIRTAGSIQKQITAERPTVATIVLVKPIATDLAITARSLRAEAQV